VIPRRGVAYIIGGQSEDTAGGIVVSSNRWNREAPNIGVIPLRRRYDEEVPFPIVEGLQAACGSVVHIASARLTEELFALGDDELSAVERSLADLLMLPSICRPDPHRPGSPRDVENEHPRWGRIYYAEPALGGQTKRWLVVSHDYWNAGSATALCVRTTSNDSYHSDVVPAIQRGFAYAVCPELQVKARARFDLASTAELPQASLDEMRAVGIGLANVFRLLEPAGLL
jgi:mRNA-degrading endonuclease toxin of MazEF toxin-antitoxin module